MCGKQGFFIPYNFRRNARFLEKLNIKTIKLSSLNKQQTCIACGNEFVGKTCNRCGEKVFEPSQLSIKYFFRQALDIFTHFENKVLKSIWLNIAKPGFITKENLRGVRIKYAKPLQLFIVVNVLFYLVVTHFNRTDYTPSKGDGNSYNLSYYPFLKWAIPYDEFVLSNIQQLDAKKFKQYTRDSALRKLRLYPYLTDTTSAGTLTFNEALYVNSYNSKVTLYSKTLIFILIPVFALVFYAFFFRQLKYFGGALILATHFLTFNLLLHSLLQAVSFAPSKWFGSKSLEALPHKLSKLLFYNEWLAPFSDIFLGLYRGFEAMYVVAFTIWLYVAFRRLFSLHWAYNLLASYVCARILFMLIFTFFKKFLIAFTLWNL